MHFLWLTVTIVPKWLVALPGSGIVAAFRHSAPAFVAGMLKEYVHDLAMSPGSAMSAAIRVSELGGRALMQKFMLPGSVLAAIRTALGSGLNTGRTKL